MSSAKYVAELQPDSLMRLVTLLATWLAGAAGVTVLCGLPVDPLLRVGAIAAWITWVACNGMRRRAAEQGLQRIRLFADGSAALLRPDGSWTPAMLGADSTVLAGLAWLHFNAEAGLPHTELLRGNSRESEDWRRLQVIWRHREQRRDGALGSSS